MIQNKDRAKIEALAEKYIKKEKYEEAIIEYQKLLSGDEQDIQVWNTIGDLFIRANKKEEAAGEFQKIADHFEKKGIFTKSIAIYKRISRLVPEDVKILKKLADLYYERGFLSEAKTEYASLSQKLAKKGKLKDAAEIYKILLRLNSDDVGARLSLAELFIKLDQFDQALEELNEAAEFKIKLNAFKEAGQILEKARSLRKDHPRTLGNMIDLFKMEKRKKDALKLVNEVLRKDKENLKALYLLGNLCFEGNEIKKAEEIFQKILSIADKEVEARVKLGRIHIQNKEYGRALDLYQPLVDTLIKKHKEEKAIGLIGLILMAKKDHVPSLEKLASIYKEKNQKKSYEIVARRLMKEYRKKSREDKMAALKKDFPDLQVEEAEKSEPVDKDLSSGLAKPGGDVPEAAEAKDIGAEGVGAKKTQTVKVEPQEVPFKDANVEETALEVTEEPPDDFIAENLGKADQFIHQGLIRNAKRILEDLKTKFPDDVQISEKLKKLGAITSQVEEEEFIERIERIAEKERELFESGEKLTSAEIFADTDIVPLVSQETGEKRYFDLSRQLEEELEAIKHIFYQQTKGDTTVVEKELSSIVFDFKRKVDEKIGTIDLEARYNLGIAYLEQGLIDDAIKEFIVASQDERWEMESLTNLGECFKRKDEFSEAIKWYDKALQLVSEESVQAYALKYEIASLYEAKKDAEKALQLFSEVLEWNPEYGDVTERIKSIENQASS